MSDDIVLSYLERLRSMTDSPRLLAHIDEVEGERIEELAQRRGEELILKMRADGSLKAKSPRKIVALPAQRHSRGNAEDCPICHDGNSAYPLLCDEAETPIDQVVDGKPLHGWTCDCVECAR